MSILDTLISIEGKILILSDICHYRFGYNQGLGKSNKGISVDYKQSKFRCYEILNQELLQFLKIQRWEIFYESSFEHFS